MVVAAARTLCMIHDAVRSVSIPLERITIGGSFHVISLLFLVQQTLARSGSQLGEEKLGKVRKFNGVRTLSLTL